MLACTVVGLHRIWPHANHASIVCSGHRSQYIVLLAPSMSCSCRLRSRLGAACCAAVLLLQLVCGLALVRADLPLSTEQLLAFADAQTEYVDKLTSEGLDLSRLQAESEVDEESILSPTPKLMTDPDSLLETAADSLQRYARPVSEAQLEREVEREAARAAKRSFVESHAYAEPAKKAEAEKAAAKQAKTAQKEATAQAQAIADHLAKNANATASDDNKDGDDEGEKPVLSIADAVQRLRMHRTNIRDLEGKIGQQKIAMDLNAVQAVQNPHELQSSGANYYHASMERVRSTDAVSVTNSAQLLAQSDARCVICQYVVQQTQVAVTGKPMTSGGATSGGKRAAAALLAQSSTATPTPTSFLELEIEAGLNALAEAGLEAQLAAESESLHALDAASRTFLAAADAALEHSATEAVASHYGRHTHVARHYPRRGSYPRQDVSSLRNMPGPTTYPRQLNDYGYDENGRNRAADILAYRPRQARFHQDVSKLQAQWDKAREAYKKLYGQVYESFETLCSRRMPQAYAPYCRELMRDYRYIAQGIQYGDRAQSICMNGNWCDRQSYIRNAVHAYFVRETGDA